MHDIVLALPFAADTPVATDMAEAAATGMAILVFICGSVWFVMSLMLNPIKERLADTVKKSDHNELDIAGVLKDVEAHALTTSKLEETLKESVDKLTVTVEKMDTKIDALAFATKSRNRDAKESS